MDPQAQPAQQTPTPPPMPPPAAEQPVKKDSSKNLTLITIAVLLFGFGLIAGFTLSKNSQVSQATPTITPTLYPTKPPISPTPLISPTSSNKKTKTIEAGMTNSPYSLEAPDGWTDARENTQAGVVDKLTLSKNGYTLTIYQAAMGGGGCLYPGDNPSEMSQTFTNFSDIKGLAEGFRRSWNQNNAQTITYTFCKKNSDGSYGNLSYFGSINATSPNPADPTILAEIDSIITSLIKK